MANIPLSDQTALAIGDICTERYRQLTDERWTREHDDAHDDGELARAAACYAMPRAHRAASARIDVPHGWPWAADWWKPCADRRRELVKAGALIVAEIERIDRRGDVRRVTDPHAETVTVEISFPQGLSRAGAEQIDALAQPPLTLDAYDSAVAEELDAAIAKRNRAYGRALGGEELTWYEQALCCFSHPAFSLEYPALLPDMFDRATFRDRFKLKPAIANAIRHRAVLALHQQIRDKP